jgi:DNA-directed RNA polymerase specialized sigma24 family protein
MDQHPPTLLERLRRSLALDPKMAERIGPNSMAAHCGRCGTPLIIRLEDIKDRRTIDCDACEKRRPAGNGLPITRSSHVPAPADAGTVDGLASVGTHVLLDDAGNPLSRRLQQVLGAIPPRLRKRSPAFGDDLLVTDVLEEAGRRIAAHERASGPVADLDAYAWVTVVNVARSRMRHPSMRVASSMLGSEESQAVLGTLPSTQGSPEQIEADILVREVLAQLSPEERWLCSLKQEGLSSREIAREWSTSITRVNILFYRAKRKIRDALRVAGAGVPSPRTGQPTKPGTV